MDLLPSMHPILRSVLDGDTVIPQMPWELVARKFSGLSHWELRFSVAFFASVLVGWGMQGLRSPVARHIYAIIPGILLIYYPFGASILIAAPPILFTYAAVALTPRFAGVLAWTVIFPYLITMHVLNASGQSWSDGRIDFTGGLMMLTLKLIAMCMSRSDYEKGTKGLSSYKAEHAIGAAPSLLEYFSYVFGFGNLLGGPFMEFNEYKEFIELKSVWDLKSQRSPPPHMLQALKRVGDALLILCAYFLLLPYWNFKIIYTDWYQSAPLHMKLLVPALSSGICILKLSFGWKLCEASMTAAGFSLSGWSADGKPLWGRAANVRLMGVLFSDSARTVPGHWNISTGTFLRRYVYERVTPANGKAGFAQLLFTQAVCGVWHGLYPGYQLFFAASALWLWTSRVIFKAEQSFPKVVRSSFLWHVAKVAYTYWNLAYYGMAFLILDFKPCLWYWGTLYFAPPLIMVAISVLGVVGSPRRKTKKA